MSEQLPKPESLQEYADSRGADVRLDRASSMLQGVKLLGLASRNGRRYAEKALREAIHLYEGAKVNVNHPKGDLHSPRDYRDRIGVIRGVRLVPGVGLFGSLQFNPKHPLAEQLTWDAEHAPENVGFSHNVLARTSRRSDGIVVESIERVHSVDLVADPATTRGLFEQATSGQEEAIESPKLNWRELTLHGIELNRPDLLLSLVEQYEEELNQRNRRIDELVESEAQLRRRERVAELLLAHGLPHPASSGEAKGRLTSEAFLEALFAAPDDQAVERLVVDRATALKEAATSRHPVSAREQASAWKSEDQPPVDAPTFVAAITSNIT